MRDDSWIGGVDGCPAGWIACLRHIATGRIRIRLAPTMSRILDGPEKPAILAVDMPMGLADHAEPGGRACERAARAVLRGRASCVFATPCRAAVYATSYDEALRLNRAAGATGRGLSRQAWNIVPKMRELDGLLRSRADARPRLHEAHPELAFVRMNRGRAVAASKHTAEGKRQRLALLAKNGLGAIEHALAHYPRRDVGADDIIDAAALCRTASLIHAGTAAVEPERPPRDEFDLEMAIKW